MHKILIDNIKPKYCCSVTLTGKAITYLTILFSITFIAFTVYVQFSGYIFLHNFATESLLEKCAFQAMCICYGEFVGLVLEIVGDCL